MSILSFGEIGKNKKNVCLHVRSDFKVNVKEVLGNGEFDGAETLWVELQMGVHT